MYICLCKGVTDHQIRDAIADGACSMRDLRAALDVANQCGKCGRDCKSLLAESAVSSGHNTALPQQWVAA